MAKRMTDSVSIKSSPHDPIASTLSAADDRITLTHWLPPREGIVPHIRIGQRWINLLWALPVGAVTLILLIALAQSLRELPGIQEFIKTYPGIAQSAPSIDSGFPWWLQVQHFLNMLFMMFIIRAENPDPRRSSATLLESGLYAWHGVVPLSAPGSGRQHLDGEGRCGNPAGMVGHPGAAPHDRARPLVALLH
jgi:hypothetical protein